MPYAVWAQTAIFAVTAVLVFWYTKETRELRHPMVRQNEIHSLLRFPKQLGGSNP